MGSECIVFILFYFMSAAHRIHFPRKNRRLYLTHERSLTMYPFHSIFNCRPVSYAPFSTVSGNLLENRFFISFYTVCAVHECGAVTVYAFGFKLIFHSFHCHHAYTFTHSQTQKPILIRAKCVRTKNFTE